MLACRDKHRPVLLKPSPDSISVPKFTNNDSPVYHPAIGLKALDTYIRHTSKLMDKPESILQHYYRKILRDTCYLTADPDTARLFALENWEPGKDLGHINQNKLRDTVYVIDAMNLCDDGEAYIFSDTTIPPLITDSYCCHPDSMFTIGDIDQDGIQEICIWLSSCASRYKSLVAYSLKAGEWKEIGFAGWDTHADSPAKEKRVKPVSKGKFRMLTKTCEYKKGKPYFVNRWTTFTIPPS
ncbi:MAG: hypothetical protein J7578_14450 [Chitinophagaceae bacterium]|nr:hypothetical protein [Chitinophagaceae bacterium]